MNFDICMNLWEVELTICQIYSNYEFGYKLSYEL